MKIAVIGTGYVGLVSGVCLAEKGHEIICVDVDAGKIASLQQGKTSMYEPGLDELVQRNIGKRLRGTTDLAAAVRASDMSLICVGTPFDGQRIDLSYIEEAARQIGAALKDSPHYHLIVVKSTVVPGTTDAIVRPALEAASGKTSGKDFGVAMNPEFLREGSAVEDFMNPDRIVIGAADSRSRDLLAQLYSVFPAAEKICTSTRTAEMIKYTANSLLGTLISFSNEIGNLCSHVEGVDVVDVMRGVHADKRLNPFQPNGQRVNPPFLSYIEAGCGFGGSCFPKDIKALVSFGESLGSEMRILESVIDVNARQPQRMISLLKEHFTSLSGLRIAVLGLAFKPDTDDLRESPAIPFIQDLLGQGARVRAYDPIAMQGARAILGNGSITYEESLEAALQGADAVALLTKWDEFKRLPALLAAMNPSPVLVDGRRMLDKMTCARYAGIGLGPMALVSQQLPLQTVDGS